MRALEPWHIVVIAIVIAVLFGWKKLPDMTRSFGRSARILRSEMDEMKNDKKSEGGAPSPAASPGDTPATPTPAAPAASSPATPTAGTTPSVPETPVQQPADHNTSA